MNTIINKKKPVSTILKYADAKLLTESAVAVAVIVAVMALPVSAFRSSQKREVYIRLDYFDSECSVIAEGRLY